jgi:NAD(P)-dependent dehydrogenase (short-subunit alcohol dehydrogenase family)
MSMLQAAHRSPRGHGELEGKTALVTGAARGFGRAVAHLLAREGCAVAVADLGARADGADSAMAGSEQLRRTVSELEGLGRRSVAIQADVTSAADCERMAAEAIAALGAIDILVANAGTATLGKAWELTEEEWDLVVDVGLKGVWLTTKYVVPHMIERRYGKIVITASRNGLRAELGYAHYNAAKAGAIHFAKSLALELGPHEINVNAVCPTQMADKSAGPPPTMATPDYWEQVVGKPNPTYKEFDAASGAENLFERGGQPDFSEVAEGVLWLVSDRARLVTGHALAMDAGYIAKRGG